MGDQYLEKFKKVRKEEEKKKIKKGEICLNLDTFDIKKARDIILKSKGRDFTDKEKTIVMKIAKKMLSATKKEFGVCCGYYILLGAEYAEKVGRGGDPYVKKKLFEAYKRNPEMFDPERVERFFIRNREMATKFRNFSKKLFPKVNYLVVLSFVYLVVGMFFLATSLTGTGYVVGFEANYTNFIGIIFFLFGIFGFFISFRKKS